MSDRVMLPRPKPTLSGYGDKGARRQQGAHPAASLPFRQARI